MDDHISDSEDELPSGWKERVSIDGKVFYACHTTQKTQWNHPISGKRKKVTGDLPYGWEKKIGDSGYVYYVDHANNKTTFTDPRLAFAVEDKEVTGDVSSIKQKFDCNSTATQVLSRRDLTGQFAIVTGANSGIGFETALTLALAGCTVTMACRNMVAAQSAAKKITNKNPDAKVHVIECDLASLKSVRMFAKQYIDKHWPLHMLILNAGILTPPHTITEDGLELSYQVNYLSHHYLARLLERVLIRSAPSRIINVSSESHRHCSIKSIDDVTLEKLSPSKENYWALSQYGVTKLLNIAFSNAMNQRKVLHKVYSNSLHPGNLISTSLPNSWWGYKLLFYLVKPFTKSLQQGAATTVFVATCKELEDVGGMYFNNCWVCEPNKLALSLEFCDKVFQLGEMTLMDKLGADAFDIPDDTEPVF